MLCMEPCMLCMFTYTQVNPGTCTNNTGPESITKTKPKQLTYITYFGTYDVSATLQELMNSTHHNLEQTAKLPLQGYTTFLCEWL